MRLMKICLQGCRTLLVIALTGLRLGQRCVDLQNQLNIDARQWQLDQPNENPSFNLFLTTAKVKVRQMLTQNIT